MFTHTIIIHAFLCHSAKEWQNDPPTSQQKQKSNVKL